MTVHLATRRCGHHTPSGPCRNQVAAAGRCAAGHPAAPAAASAAPTAAHAAAADPFAPSQRQPIPNPRLADADHLEEYENSDEYGYVSFNGFEADSRETFDPSELTANQDELDPATIARLQADPPDEPILVLRALGHNWIFDGNHRVEVADLEGRLIEGDVMDLDAGLW